MNFSIVRKIENQLDVFGMQKIFLIIVGIELSCEIEASIAGAVFKIREWNLYGWSLEGGRAVAASGGSTP